MTRRLVRPGDLAAGQGYVQFCLFGGDGTFVSSQRFAAVN